MKYGGQNLFSYQINVNSAATKGLLKLYGTLNAANATNVQRGEATLDVNITGAGIDTPVGGVTQSGSENVLDTALTVDSTANQNFQITCTMNTNNANAQVQADGAYLELL